MFYRISIYALILLSCGCSLNPSWLLDREYDWDSKHSLFPDTPKNRDRALTTYASQISREAAGEPNDWVIGWKRVFEALNQSQENAQLYKDYIIQERRKFGLKELPFTE